MKKNILSILFIALLFIFSCSKESVKPAVVCQLESITGNGFKETYFYENGLTSYTIYKNNRGSDTTKYSYTADKKLSQINFGVRGAMAKFIYKSENSLIV